MELFSLPEFIQWAAQLKASAESLTAPSASNAILIAYLIAYLTNRKSCFIVAFFIFEFVGVLTFYDSYGLHYRYLAYSIAISLMYWYLFISGYKLKILSGYVIMLLFQLAMVTDAYIYYDVETFLWTYYEYIIVAIHLYIVSTITNRKRLDKIASDFVGYLRNIYSTSYNLPFWYNGVILFDKKQKL